MDLYFNVNIIGELVSIPEQLRPVISTIKLMTIIITIQMYIQLRTSNSMYLRMNYEYAVWLMNTIYP